MIIVYTIYFNRMAKARKEEFQSGLGRCIAMAIGMITGTTIGMIAAVLIPQLLAVSTIAAIIVSSITVFFIGKPFGMTGIIEAISSSLMGAMMGAMLGAMLQSPWTNLMVAAFDVIYIISIFSLGLLLGKNEQKVKLSILVSLILPLCIIGAAAFLQTADMKSGNNMMMNDMGHPME